MNPFASILGRKKGVIIHHWDTDGIVSAAILRNYFAEHYPDKTVELFVPEITNYFLTEEQFAYLQAQHYDFVLTCDFNLPADMVQRLAELWPDQVYFFDHHHHDQPYDTVHYYNKLHPACASYICEVLGLPCDLLPVIAMVGDREEGIQQDATFYPYVQAVVADNNITFSELLQIRELIDSNYIMDDYAGIMETIKLVQDDPLAVLNDVRLQTNLSTIAQTVEQYVTQPPQQLSNVVSAWEISTKYNVLSHITRHLSRAYPDKIIFTRQRKGDQTTCYIRRRTLAFDVRQMIEFAHSLGLNSGGKEEVAGIIIPQARLEEFLPKIQQHLLDISATVA